MTNSVLIFDTETTGLPEFLNKNYHPPKNFDKYDNSRIIEIGYRILSQENNELLVQFQSCINFEGMDIKNSHIHGVSNEMALAGMSILDLLNEIENDMKNYNVKRIVAHNIDFDMNILLSECYRYNKEGLASLLLSCETFCTMKRGKIFMDFYKNPKLIELYNFVYRNNAPPFKEHSAMSDCIACEKCYLAIVK